MVKKTGCLICGKKLNYSDKPKIKHCDFCQQIFETLVTCENNHYVCDSCHRLEGNDFIEEICVKSKEKDPLKLAFNLMKNPKIKMHGPEHHFLVPAVLLSSYYNNTGEFHKKTVKIEEGRNRSEKILGGFCGSHGVCGAAVGCGIFISLITDSTPLSKKEWKLSNQITAESLKEIAKYGGPRCCKRNTFLAIIGALNFLEKHFKILIKSNKQIVCGFNDLNQECIMKKCPFYPFKSKN